MASPVKCDWNARADRPRRPSAGPEQTSVVGGPSLVVGGVVTTPAGAQLISLLSGARLQSALAACRLRARGQFLTRSNQPRGAAAHRTPTQSSLTSSSRNRQHYEKKTKKAEYTHIYADSQSLPVSNNYSAKPSLCVTLGPMQFAQMQHYYNTGFFFIGLRWLYCICATKLN